MVTGWQCVLPSLVLFCTLCATHPTLHQDDSETLVEKRSAEYPYKSMLHYLLVAMSSPDGQQQAPQLLNRGVRRLGSEFLGKRSADSLDGKSNHSCEDCNTLEDLDDLRKEQPSFTGQYDYNEGNAVELAADHDLTSAPMKRFARRYYSGVTRDGLKNFFSLLMSKKMGSEFLGKRMGSEFLGKRAMGSEFLGKRAMGSEFLGKRAMGSEFLGKRAMGSEFLGKRAMGSEFLGKRAMGSEFLGKRAMGSEFLGKRAMGSEFLGKRNYDEDVIPVSDDLYAKRAMGSEFLA
ncbi:ribosome-binding protein 1-like [Macrobrachium nipponense]|uniref:ribosome-binding protein 1-like n=1 Tax=Macrobrachium nipponense TaxID=159736 RepID=UPI0030C80680